MRYLLLSVVFVAVMLVSAQPESSFPVDLETLTTENIASLELLTAYEWDTKQISISPNGEIVAVATQSSDFPYTVVIHDILSGDPIMTIVGRMDFFRELIWSPDSQYLATITGRRTGAGVQERSVRIYTVSATPETNIYNSAQANVSSVEYIYPPQYPEPQIDSPVELVWSPSSDMIAVAFYDRLAIFSPTSETELFSVEASGIAHVEWASNGQAIVTEDSDGYVQLWGISSAERMTGSG